MYKPPFVPILSFLTTLYLCLYHPSGLHYPSCLYHPLVSILSVLPFLVIQHPPIHSLTRTSINNVLSSHQYPPVQYRHSVRMSYIVWSSASTDSSARTLLMLPSLLYDASRILQLPFLSFPFPRTVGTYIAPQFSYFYLLPSLLQALPTLYSFRLPVYSINPLLPTTEVVPTISA